MVRYCETIAFWRAALRRRRTDCKPKVVSAPLIALAICLIAATTAHVGASQSGGASAVLEPSHEASAYTIDATDITASIHITESDSKELAKIGSDFTTTYSLRNMSLLYKQPDKLRLEGKSTTRGSALMIMNGADRFVDVPRFKIHVHENLSKSPSRRQSLLEIGGVISPDTLKFMTGKYLRPEMLDGRSTVVFEMRYTGASSGQYYRLWLDTANHTTVKREWFDAESHLRATFNYDQPKEISSGIWLPTRVLVKNADGAVAAVIIMQDIKVNQGLVDGLFMIPA